MNKTRHKMPTDSLTFRNELNFVIVMSLMLATVLATVLYSIRLLNENTRAGMASNSALYAVGIENNLEMVSTGLSELVELAADQHTGEQEDSLQQYLDSKGILTALQQRSAFVEAADLFWFYRTDSDELLMSVSARLRTGASWQWEQYLRNQPEQVTGVWYLEEIAGEPTLIMYYNVRTIRVGAAVRVRTLFQELYAGGRLPDAEYAFADKNGTILYAANDSYAAVGTVLPPETVSSDGLYLANSRIAACDGYLYVITPSSSVYGNLIRTSILIALLGAGVMLVSAAFMRRANRAMLTGVRLLVAAVGQVEQGNWQYRIQGNAPIREFRQLFAGFNHMIGEIGSLKIQTYEAELERHRSELRYLQMQIRPHFYLNAISTISSLLYKDRKEDARAFIDALSVYLRYLFNAEDTRATLADEINHSEMFIRLQQIKYPDSIFSMTRLEPGTEERIIPKFLIQTLVENVFKHGFRHDDFLSIFIEGKIETVEGAPVLVISVEDSGCGFEPALLEGFPDNLEPDHVGLGNLYHTLKLIYGREGLIRISNVEPHGARVVVMIPQEGENGDVCIDCG